MHVRGQKSRALFEILRNAKWFSVIGCVEWYATSHDFSGDQTETGFRH
jgi:hypothetical protein